MRDVHAEVRNQRTLDVSHRLLRREFRRREKVNLVDSPSGARDDSGGHHDRQRGEKLLGALNWSDASGDQRRLGRWRRIAVGERQRRTPASVRQELPGKDDGTVPPSRRKRAASPESDIKRGVNM